MTASLSARRPKTAGATPSPPRPFDMAAHRAWFGRVCGANGKTVAAMIRGEAR